MDINTGVPQGSCLEHVLLLLYIDDLPQAVQHSTIAMYVDGTSLSYQFDDIYQLNEAMNKDLTTTVIE